MERVPPCQLTLVLMISFLISLAYLRLLCSLTSRYPNVRNENKATGTPISGFKCYIINRRAGTLARLAFLRLVADAVNGWIDGKVLLEAVLVVILLEVAALSDHRPLMC